MTPDYHYKLWKPAVQEYSQPNIASFIAMVIRTTGDACFEDGYTEAEATAEAKTAVRAAVDAWNSFHETDFTIDTDNIKVEYPK